MPLDAIEEFSVQSQGGAEVGRNSGAVVNLIIKSGTNQLHGTAYYYNRNEALSASSPFAAAGAPKLKLRNQHYGASFGGPIRRDRTFYFVTFEKQKFIIGQRSLTTQPSYAYQAAAKDLMAQYGVPVNPVSERLLTMLWPSYVLTGPASPNNYFATSPETGISNNGLAKVITASTIAIASPCAGMSVREPRPRRSAASFRTTTKSARCMSTTIPRF